MFASIRRTFFVAVMGVMVLTGCAATGPQFTGLDAIPQGNANIYVYRAQALAAVGQSFTLSMDEKTVGSLYNASYQKISTTSGKHVLEIAPGGLSKNSKLEVTVEPNKNYFYEYTFATGLLANPFFVGSAIEVRDQVKALDDLTMLKRAE